MHSHEARYFLRADERTRTALLLITSDNSGVAERCTVLRSWWCQKFVDYTSTGEEGKYRYHTRKMATAPPISILMPATVWMVLGNRP
jgi:hypothetical protein